MGVFVDSFPAGVTGSGTTTVTIASSITNLSAPSLAEVAATSSIDATAYFQAANPFSPTHSQGKVDDTRMSDQTAREDFGRSTFAVDNLRIIYDPQGADVAGNKAAFATIAGTTKYLVVRYGIASTTALAATQKVDIYQAKFGDRHKITPGTGDDSKHVMEIQVALNRVAEGVALAA